jgi:hypothetical protein
VTDASVLARCEGYGVYTQLAHVGTVESVRMSAGENRPASLTVRTGLLGSWLLEVPADQVAEVSPRERRLVLRSGGLVERVRRGEADTPGD